MNCVYIARDARGDVLYVGRTRDISRRITSHHTSRWWEEGVHYEVHPVASSVAAAHLEYETIRRLDPPHNVDWAPTGETEHAAAGERVALVVKALAGSDRPLTTTEIREITGYKNAARTLYQLHHTGRVSSVPLPNPRGGHREINLWSLPAEVA